MEFTTFPNVLLNGCAIEKIKCFSGDWESFLDVCTEKFDYIFTSETIYNTKNYKKLLKVFQNCCEKNCVMYPFFNNNKCLSLKYHLNKQNSYVAAKTYYFGVGGGIQEFRKEVEQLDFNVSTAWKCDEGIKREILKITRLN